MDAKIFTYRGCQVDLVAPDPKTISILDIAHALSNVCRFAGHTQDFYSVAQHSVLVHDIVIREGHPEKALAALMHDAAEAYLGDLSTPLKAMLPHYGALERRMLGAIQTALHVYIPEGDPDIKHADLVALATEKRDVLFFGGGPSWDMLQGIRPREARILSMDPEEAEHTFLRTYFAPRRTHA